GGVRENSGVGERWWDGRANKVCRVNQPANGVETLAGHQHIAIDGVDAVASNPQFTGDDELEGRRVGSVITEDPNIAVNVIPKNISTVELRHALASIHHSANDTKTLVSPGAVGVILDWVG